MRNFDPDSEENAVMTRDNDRAAFAAQMQHQNENAQSCPRCFEHEVEDGECQNCGALIPQQNIKDEKPL